MSRGIIRKARFPYTQSNGDLGRADRVGKGELKLDETS